MVSLYVYRVVSLCWALCILLFRKFKDDDYQNSQIAQRFLHYNNQFTLRRLQPKHLHNQQMLILLPHCLQNYDCPFKITSFIENCKQCGKCDISTLVALKGRYPIHINVATGGTLARKYIRDRRPKLVIAVACERDLISGIIDSFPLPVYGIFNKRPYGPCFNTSVLTDEIEQLLSRLLEA
jgi:hypothetical protein